MHPTLVQWMVRIHPDTWVYPGGEEPVFTTTTAGWEWEAARAVGRQLATRGTTLRIVRQLMVEPQLTVFGSEITAATVLGEPGARDFLQKVAIRCVCGAVDGIEIWDKLAPVMPRINGLSTIGEAEARLLEPWAKKHGYKGTPIHIAPLSADEFVQTTIPRTGFAFLGTANREKRVPLIAKAAALADVPLFLGLVYSNEKNSEDLDEIQRVMGPKTTLLQVGVESRKRLLGLVKGAITFSNADSQWLPGTEARACGGIAIAGDFPGIRTSNGDSILYVPDGDVEAMARVLKVMENDPEAYAQEQQRQAALFPTLKRTTPEVTVSLCQWLDGILASP